MTPLFAIFLAAATGDPLLDRNFPNPELSYIVMDARTREVVASRWEDADTAMPVGSLVKPFLSLAFGGEFPDFTCHGKSDRCWLDRGHGAIRFREALANSCNAYFLRLAGGVETSALQVVASSYGIPAPATNSAEARIGLSDGWKIAPAALLRAYTELAARRTEPKVAEILAGLELAGERGTARAIGRGVLTKTGTAACVARKKHAGDGLTVVLDPADSPRTALIIRMHGVPGAEAAKTASRMLRMLKTGR
jgi:cell division protein FtsI/penicillin-binding protein 2